MAVLPKDNYSFNEKATYLTTLLDNDPIAAISQARRITFDVIKSEHINWINLKAAILVDGGVLTQEKDVIKEGLELFQELYSQLPIVSIAYNLANGLVALAGSPPHDSSWLDHQENTRQYRTQARQYFWMVAQDLEADSELRTQAWTNLANQFSNSYRLSEAHDAWLSALKIDPENGVAAISAAHNLLWLYEKGDCSDLTRVEAIMLAKIAQKHQDKIVQYAGMQAAEQIAAFIKGFEDPPLRTKHKDTFIRWVENERLTLAPTVELIEPDFDKVDWLMLPGVLEREPSAKGMPPPIFAMFNMLKSDFILARDLVWRALDKDTWPTTGQFGDTLDYATYGPDTSALILAHRTALDLLDKVAVTANHYFELGIAPDRVYFGKLWRKSPDKKTGIRELSDKVRNVIHGGVSALYGLIELADDYDNSLGILRSQKDLRNAGTHRFVVLHDFGNPSDSRQAPEIEHHGKERFTNEVLYALRIARSAIQMLTLSISQHERGLKENLSGIVGSLVVPDHDYIRGRDKK